MFIEDHQANVQQRATSTLRVPYLGRIVDEFHTVGEFRTFYFANSALHYPFFYLAGLANQVHIYFCSLSTKPKFVLQSLAIKKKRTLIIHKDCTYFRNHFLTTGYNQCHQHCATLKNIFSDIVSVMTTTFEWHSNYPSGDRPAI